MSRKKLVAAVVGLLVISGAAALLLKGSDQYLLRAEIEDAGGMRQGANVRIDGVPIGSISKLELDENAVVQVEMRLQDSVVPVGRDASMTAQIDGIFGERYIDLRPGDPKRPAPSGFKIPRERAAVSVRLDDVLDTLDMPTRDALQVFLNEQGAALVGRGQDLRTLLAVMGPSLQSTGDLLDQLSRDNRALGRLIEESDRIVASVARERPELGRLIDEAGAALDTLASRRRELGETVRRAPATLASARRALVALQAAAVPLAPAARGLRATAPQLAATLEELPAFTRAALPTLTTIRSVSPRLGELGARGAPLVRRLRPLARELARYGGAADPFFEVLATEAPDLLGTMEGWARATQGKDNASHVFRFGASSSRDTFALLLGDAAPGDGSTSSKRRRDTDRGQRDTRPPGSRSAPGDGWAAPVVPDLRDLGTLPGPSAGAPRTNGAGQQSSDSALLDFLLGP